MIVRLIYIGPYTISLILRYFARSRVARFISLWWSLLMLLMLLTVQAADHGCTLSDDRFQASKGSAGFVASLANVTGFLTTGLHVGISPILAGIAAASGWKSRQHATTA